MEYFFGNAGCIFFHVVHKHRKRTYKKEYIDWLHPLTVVSQQAEWENWKKINKNQNKGSIDELS